MELILDVIIIFSILFVIFSVVYYIGIVIDFDLVLDSCKSKIDFWILFIPFGYLYLNIRNAYKEKFKV